MLRLSLFPWSGVPLPVLRLPWVPLLVVTQMCRKQSVAKAHTRCQTKVQHTKKGPSVHSASVIATKKSQF